MNNPAFLDTAETRAAHLRELSHHLRSLEWTNASRREVEHEIPELELAMAVYRRLNAEEGNAEEGAKAFLSVADGRADHLRQVSHHMHALEWVHASLTEVENEIPELELAMTVYRRLSGEAEAPSRSSAKATASSSRSRPVEPPAPAPVATETEDAPEPAPAEGDAAPAPSFSQFAMAHLDQSTESAESAAAANGSV